MVMIGTEDGAENGDARELIDFYHTIMENNPRYVIGTWDECECIKVFYNTFISAKLSLVNMIQDVAERQGNINVDVVTDALSKSTQRIMGPQYMTAGMGDGGACHPRDNIALRYLAQELELGYDLFESIMLARDIQAQNLAKLLVKLASKNNMDLVIHGKAYKPSVGYTEGSYSLLVGYFCEQEGIKPIYIDPKTGDNHKPNTPCVLLMAHNSAVTYKYMKNITSTKLYCDIPNGSIVVDPWRNYVNDNCNVIYYGNTRNV
jgi:UDPglucose 6-dehydrogenase